jgi:hypothetical protein
MSEEEHIQYSIEEIVGIAVQTAEELEPEDTTAFIKEEVIQESANQIPMRTIPDVQFEEIYKDEDEYADKDEVKKELNPPSQTKCDNFATFTDRGHNESGGWMPLRICAEETLTKFRRHKQSNMTPNQILQFTENPLSIANIRLPPTTIINRIKAIPQPTRFNATSIPENPAAMRPGFFEIPEIVFIVPYRDRESHRIMFANTMKTALTNSPPYRIFYVHQTDNRGFNRGAMKNIGFLVVKKLYPEHYKNITLVFNDVDTMPTKTIQLNYKTKKGTIKHFYGFNYTLGGIVSINAEDFESLNGFPNFWAWGYEDNLLQIRATKRGIEIDRSVFYKIHDPRIIHLSDSFIREVNREEFERYLQNTSEGIDSIEDLKYAVNDGNGFIDVLQFNTTSRENAEKRIDYDLRNGPAPFKEPAKNPRRAPTIKMFF